MAIDLWVLFFIILWEGIVGFLKGLREFALIPVADHGCDFFDGIIRVKQQIRRFFHTMFLCVRCNGIAEFLSEDGFYGGCVDTEMFCKGIDCDVLVQMGIQVIVYFRGKCIAGVFTGTAFFGRGFLFFMV